MASEILADSSATLRALLAIERALHEQHSATIELLRSWGCPEGALTHLRERHSDILAELTRTMLVMVLAK